MPPITHNRDIPLNTGWLIGILIYIYIYWRIPYITGSYFIPSITQRKPEKKNDHGSGERKHLESLREKFDPSNLGKRPQKNKRIPWGKGKLTHSQRMDPSIQAEIDGKLVVCNPKIRWKKSIDFFSTELPCHSHWKSFQKHKLLTLLTLGV